MTETIITSSLLILIILALRYLLRGRISSQLQYALWLLVAIRLLLPFPLFENPVSVMNVIPVTQMSEQAAIPQAAGSNPPEGDLTGITLPTVHNSIAASGPAAGAAPVAKIARYIWLCGLFLTGSFFAISNIRLNRNLKKNRKKLDIPGSPLPVYLADHLSSPCLYGIIRPAVYLTPDSLTDQKRTSFVLAHELTHYRHRDYLWALIRIVCLSIYWFHPLVWAAAVLSRRDSELACDEGTLRKLGHENRAEYGRMIIEMSTAPSKPSELFCCATTMTGGKKEMTERIRRIARQPKTLLITLAAVVIAAAAAVALTFGSAANKSDSKQADAQVSDEQAPDEQVPDVQVPDMQELWDARTPYVGDNAAVGKLLGLLPLPDGLQHDHFELHTGGNERGITWILKEVSDYTSVTPGQFQQDALLLFALVDNLEDFYAALDTSPADEPLCHYTRRQAEELVGGDLRDYAKSPETLQELILFSAEETPKYRIAKLENGKMTSEFPMEDNGLADDILMNVLVKSAAWEGIDISTLDECYQISQIFPNANEVHDYYAYLLEDGRAVLQSGTDGYYSILSQELYSELLEFWRNLTADPWLENSYTEGIPRPDFDNLLWMTTDDEKGYCAVCYQDVSREQTEAYLQVLAADGWRTIQDFYEDTTVGGLYEKDGRSISIQFAGRQTVLYFSLKQD